MTSLPMSDLGLGVASGLAAAGLSALSYLISRHHGLQQRATGRQSVALRLLVLAHVIMAAVCIPVVYLLWPMASPAWQQFAAPLLASTGFYVLGQSALFAALKAADASQISPLLGLKVVMLALLVTFVMGTALDARQWLAVALSVAAAAILQTGRGGVSLRAFGCVLFCCICFAIADILIVSLINGLQTGVAEAGGSISRLHGGVLALTLTYGLCGGLSAPLALTLRPYLRTDWISAGQYSTTWLGSMLGLYCCFGLVGVVFGNILQSTRGVMNVALGAWLAHLGWHDLEQKVDRAMLIKRIAAALLMTAAITLSVIDLS